LYRVAKRIGPAAYYPEPKHQKKHKRKGKKMPANVVAYFKYRNEGLSKQAAKRKAGLS
jgi:hypothetical protein